MHWHSIGFGLCKYDRQLLGWCRFNVCYGFQDFHNGFSCCDNRRLFKEVGRALGCTRYSLVGLANDEFTLSAWRGNSGFWYCPHVGVAWRPFGQFMSQADIKPCVAPICLISFIHARHACWYQQGGGSKTGGGREARILFTSGGVGCVGYGRLGHIFHAFMQVEASGMHRFQNCLGPRHLVD